VALTIFWTKRADKKFDKIILYLQEEFGENVTRSFVKRVYELLDVLSEFPEMGNFQHEEKEIRGFVVIKQVTMFYKVRDENIIILNLFDNRQSPKKRKI
jgi:plasmid stabilization system protein ParE